MIGSFLEGLLRSATANSVTELFIWIMVAIFVVAVLQGKKGKHGQFLEHAPAVLVSLGILGTFIGIVIALRGSGSRATMTVRKVSFGQGVERIFPLHARTIEKIDVVRHAYVRRAKLNFLRDKKGKEGRMRERKLATA